MLCKQVLAVPSIQENFITRPLGGHYPDSEEDAFP